MEDDVFYPSIDEGKLKLIAKLYSANPQYFNNLQCPYSKEVKEIFLGVAKHQDFDYKMDEVPSSDNLLTQLNQLTKELKDYGKEISNSAEGNSASDKNTYFRLSVTLIEKLIDIKEKLVKISDYELFVSEVLDIMDRILNADQVAEVTSRLEKFKESAAQGTTDSATPTNINKGDSNGQETTDSTLAE